MTTNPPGRLDRIEALLGELATRQEATQQQLDRSIEASNARAETIFLAIQQLAAAQQAAQSELQANIADVVSMITTQAEQAESDRAVMREIQSEVRGLQTENRRIWEIMQRQQGDDPGDRA